MTFAEIAIAHTEIARTGIGLGILMAIVYSWQRDRSILWESLTGLLSWFYMICFAVTRHSHEVK